MSSLDIWVANTLLSCFSCHPTLSGKQDNYPPYDVMKFTWRTRFRIFCIIFHPHELGYIPLLLSFKEEGNKCLYRAALIPSFCILTLSLEQITNFRPSWAPYYSRFLVLHSLLVSWKNKEFSTRMSCWNKKHPSVSLLAVRVRQVRAVASVAVI